MAITLVLHEATRTGAPRVGGLIARELAKAEDLRVIVLRDGPLVPWLADTVGPERLVVCASEEFSHRIPFDQRLKSAVDMLSQCDGDLVYVNSLAASTFVLAARSIGRYAVLHVHEKAEEIYNLLRHDLAKIEVMSATDAVVLAADDLASDIVEVFGFIPDQILNFGIAVDVDAVRRAAEESGEPARNASGEVLRKTDRLLIGMCGHASRRKGVDVFFDVAQGIPEHDFLWIGGWAPEESIENVAFDQFVEKKIPNFYVTGATDNPYCYMRPLDLFFLSSREDPNPLVLAEAVVLQIPILSFSKTTAVGNRLGRTAILCYGVPNCPDAERVIRACAASDIRDKDFRSLADESIVTFDLREKMQGVLSLIEKIRNPEKANLAEQVMEIAQ